ncbi:MAG: transmembrane 220 family protein [Saprospiraceae bacterium]|nr:transmembrane 220 family protein [Saprospiraceae bacterium]
MKILNILLTILFVLFAIVQMNDPDPLLWVVIYGLVAVVSGLAILGKYYKGIVYLGIAVCVIGLGILFPELINWIRMGTPNLAETMKTERSYIEFVREFFGLGISLAALVFHFFQMRKNEVNV